MQLFPRSRNFTTNGITRENKLAVAENMGLAMAGGGTLVAGIGAGIVASEAAAAAAVVCGVAAGPVLLFGGLTVGAVGGAIYAISYAWRGAERVGNVRDYNERRL